MTFKPSDSQSHSLPCVSDKNGSESNSEQNRGISEVSYCPVLDLISVWLYELEGSHFEVILVPPARLDNEGQMLRACVSANPRWYQRFADQYTSARGIGRKKMRRPRTYIKKVDCIRALKRILAGNFQNVLAERLLDFARRELDRVETSNFVEGIPF